MGQGQHRPLYSRLQERIAELILSGKLAPDARIQSEREFSEDLGVSRMTVRRALTELVNEGLLERKQGSGTYVAKPKVTYEAAELANYAQAMQRRNIATASQLLEFCESVASRRLAQSLGVEIGSPIYRVAILRLANRVPVVLERDFVSCARFPGLQDWDLEKTSMQDLLTDIYGITVGQISQTLEAVVASDTVARQLRVDDGFPLLMLSRLVLAGDGEPLVFSQDFLRGDYARIHADTRLAVEKPSLDGQPGKEECTGDPSCIADR
jgi:GntR family transcriptional regulator